MGQPLTIGHLARRAGDATPATRSHESLGPIGPERTTATKRRYDPATLRRVPTRADPSQPLGGHPR